MLKCLNESKSAIFQNIHSLMRDDTFFPKRNSRFSHAQIVMQRVIITNVYEMGVLCDRKVNDFLVCVAITMPGYCRNP